MKPHPLLTSHLLLLTLFMAPAAAAQSQDRALEHARKLLKSTPLIDGHNDLPWEIRESKTAPRDVAAYDLRIRTPKHTTSRARSRTAAMPGCSWSSSTSPGG
jgi:membrane dipeptidase